jgi:DNA polymerase-3 subunit beta
MKVTVLQEDLSKGLSVVGRVVASRGQLPVLSNVLLEASGEGLRLSATNLEIGMRMGVGGKTTEDGAVTVPAKNLSEFVNSLSSGPVELQTEGDKLKIGAGKFGATFAGIGAAEFPALPERDKDAKIQGVKVERRVVEEIGREVAYAAATDESRPVLTGIRLQISGDSLVVVGTDGFRMSRKIIKFQILGGSGQFDQLDGLIIPARTILELARIVGEGQKEKIEIEVASGSNQIIFGGDKVELISRVLEGNFPDVAKIVSTEYKSQIIVDREELVRAVRAAAIFARDNNNIIRLNVQGSMLKVKATASQTGESEIEVEVESEGEEVEIAFNYRYVMDFLNSVSDERVIMQTNGSLAPGVWRVEKREDLLHLIMPVRV